MQDGAYKGDVSAAKELVRALTLATRMLGFTDAPSIWHHVTAPCLDSLVDLAPLKRHRDRLGLSSAPAPRPAMGRAGVGRPGGAGWKHPRSRRAGHAECR